MSQARTLVSRVCPECLNRSFFEDPESQELCCNRCGLVLAQNQLPDRDNDGYEQETHSATNTLHFDGALGTDMDRRTTYMLMARKQIGTRGREDLGVRYTQLRAILGDKNDGERMLHSAQEYASKLLEKCGLKYTPVSPDQESRLSHIYGNDLGRLIRKFYGKLISDLSHLGYLPFVTIKHSEIVENMLALMLVREAILNNDRRRYYRIAPHLRRLRPDTMQVLTLHLYPKSHVNASSPSRMSTLTVSEAPSPP